MVARSTPDHRPGFPLSPPGTIMSSTSDFVAATLADLLLPFFRRPVEDVIIETLDQRQVPIPDPDGAVGFEAVDRGQ